MKYIWCCIACLFRQAYVAPLMLFNLNIYLLAQWNTTLRKIWDGFLRANHRRLLELQILILTFKTKIMMNKEDEYAKKIISHMAELFDDNEGENFIDTKEFMEGNNATHFTHALVNISPAMIIKKLTGSDMNLLEFNHMANQLVFQYSDLVKK